MLSLDSSIPVVAYHAVLSLVSVTLSVWKCFCCPSTTWMGHTVNTCVYDTLFNHTATGQARFLINRAAMGQAWFLIYFCFFCFFCYVRYSCRIYFFRFYRGVRFEENFKYTKNRWNVLTLQLSLLLRDKSQFAVFFLPEPTVVNWFWILRVSAVGLDNSFIKTNSEIWRKIKYLLR